MTFRLWSGLVVAAVQQAEEGRQQVLDVGGVAVVTKLHQVVQQIEHLKQRGVTSRDVYMYWTSVFSLRQCYNNNVVGPISALYLLPVAVETKMADAPVEYKRVDLRSYEARNSASFAQSFKYNFSFPSMYRRLKSTRLIQCYERKKI